jgi:hypothetical protein
VRARVLPPPLAAAAPRKLQPWRAPESTPPLYWDFEVPQHARTTPTWLRVLGAGIGAGALTAAGYFLVVSNVGQHTPTLSSAAHAETHVSVAAAAEPIAHDSLVLEAAPAAPELSVSDMPSFTAAVLPERASQAARSTTVTHAAQLERVRLKIAAPVVKAKVSKIEPKQPLAAHPSREDVKAGYESVRIELNECARGAHGTGFANLTIIGDGRVSYSMIGGDFAGTQAGTCMARALRSTSFAPFSGESFTVRFQFTL